jgi:hypothetical protein
MQSIEERLARVERLVLRWKLAAIVLFMAVLGFAAMGAQPLLPTYIPDVIHARRIDLVNEKGTVVASVGQIKGNGSLALYNENGKMQFVVAGTQDGGVFSICNGDRQLIRGGGSGNGGRIDILNGTGQEAVMLNSAGAGFIGVFDARGNIQNNISGTPPLDAEQRVRERAKDGFPE